MSMTLSRWRTAGWLRRAGAVLAGMGLVLLVLGLVGVSRADYLVGDISYLLSGGLAGTFCIVVGTAMVVSGDAQERARRIAGRPGSER
jgi:hypothetical protein